MNNNFEDKMSDQKNEKAISQSEEEGVINEVDISKVGRRTDEFGKIHLIF